MQVQSRKIVQVDAGLDQHRHLKFAVSTKFQLNTPNHTKMIFAYVLGCEGKNRNAERDFVLHHHLPTVAQCVAKQC